MTKKLVSLDQEKIFPTGYPRVGSAFDLRRATSISDINFEGIQLDDIGDGNLYVRHGHHRIARALELQPGAVIEVEVIASTEQDILNIMGAKLQFSRNEELRNYAEYIERTRWLRRDV